ncbi:MAG: N-acetyltransferase [Candidatus Latescibacterota bacterium]|nr:MAG: N-acetyltransferase [Candidatus Latescibacterota bacterium]
MLTIYEPIVSGTAISFEITPPTAEEFGQRVRELQERNPWLVCETRDRLLGFAYSRPHRSRPAYQWSVEVSVYVDSKHLRQGVGQALYTSLLNVLRLQGYRNVYALINIPNPASTALHRSMGFEPLVVFKSVGHKLGAWHDVQWWQLILRDKRPRRPQPPLSMADVQKLDGWARALRSGLDVFEKTGED